MDPYTAPHFASSAVITIDTQQDTLDGGAFEVPGTSAVLPRMRRVLDVYRHRGITEMKNIGVVVDDADAVAGAVMASPFLRRTRHERDGLPNRQPARAPR